MNYSPTALRSLEDGSLAAPKQSLLPASCGGVGNGAGDAAAGLTAVLAARTVAAVTAGAMEMAEVLEVAAAVRISGGPVCCCPLAGQGQGWLSWMGPGREWRQHTGYSQAGRSARFYCSLPATSLF